MYKLILGFVLFVFVTLSMACGDQIDRNKLIKTVLKENKSFSVRVSGYKQSPTIGLAGVDYLIESSIESDGVWKKVMIVSHDDGIEFSENNIIYPTPTVGFVFMSRKYAVTLDCGQNWQIYEIKKRPSCRIDNVKLSSNGSGEMELKCNLDKVKSFTTDYGVNWQH